MGRSMQATKYVYAVKSVAFPGLIKIGRTQNVRERLSQLNTSCAPCPFVVVVVSPTLDCVRDEKMAHEFFSLQRREGEFFSVSESEVIDFFKTIREKFDLELSQPRSIDSESDRARKANCKFVMRLLYGNIVDKLEKEKEASCVSHTGPESSLKRKREHEDLLFDMEMEERKMGLEERKMGLEERKMGLAEREIALVNTAMSSINALHDLANVDERTKNRAKDLIKNILFNRNRMQTAPEYQSAAEYSHT